MRTVVLQSCVSMMALLVCPVVLVSLGAPRDAVAQQHPVMSNVIPDGGTGAIEGKVQSVDPSSRQVTINPQGGHSLALYAAPDVRLDNLEPGDSVAAEFSRTVFWAVTPVSAPAPQGATETVGTMAHRPGGVGPGATQISGRVTKINDGDHSFDVVDASGGGVYTVQVVDPNRMPMMSVLKVGSAITVVMSPLTITHLEKCGWFGCL